MFDVRAVLPVANRPSAAVPESFNVSRRLAITTSTRRLVDLAKLNYFNQRYEYRDSLNHPIIFIFYGRTI